MTIDSMLLEARSVLSQVPEEHHLPLSVTIGALIFVLALTFRPKQQAAKPVQQNSIEIVNKDIVFQPASPPGKPAKVVENEDANNAIPFQPASPPGKAPKAVVEQKVESSTTTKQDIAFQPASPPGKPLPAGADEVHLVDENSAPLTTPKTKATPSKMGTPTPKSSDDLGTVLTPAGRRSRRLAQRKDV